MQPIPCSPSFRRSEAAGFTIIELLVGMFLCAIIGTVVTKSLVLYSNTFREDMLRLRVQQNVRGALDIVSINTRQAGEGLDRYFPALTVEPGFTPGNSELTLRRRIVSEVFTACRDIPALSDQIYVSDNVSVFANCLPVNVVTAVDSWRANRISRGGNIRIYLYDRVAKLGEFVDYSADPVTVEGNNLLTIDGPQIAYPARSTSIYILEEYLFRLDASTNTLQVIVDGNTEDPPQDVAYQITQFAAELRMQDGTTKTSLVPTDAVGWKDVRAVNFTVTGQESWRTATMSRTLKAGFFPRNVLSK